MISSVDSGRIIKSWQSPVKFALGLTTSDVCTGKWTTPFYFSSTATNCAGVSADTAGFQRPSKAVSAMKSTQSTEMDWLSS